MSKNIKTCPLTKINAVYNNSAFNRNEVDVLIALITAVDNETNEGNLGNALWMRKTRMSRTSFDPTKKKLIDSGVIEEVRRGCSKTHKVSRWKLNPIALLTYNGTEQSIPSRSKPFYTTVQDRKEWKDEQQDGRYDPFGGKQVVEGY